MSTTGKNMEYDVRNFDEEVILRSRTLPVLVDFWAEWCGPCRILSPILERLAEKSGGKWHLAKVNTEEFPDVAASYGIQSIPNVKLFFDGEVVGEFVGALPEHAVAQWLKQNLPSRHRTEIRQAADLITKQQYPDAQRILERTMGEEPDNEEVRVLLAQAIVFNNPARAAELVREADDPRYSEIVEGVRTLVRLFETQADQLPGSPAKAQYLAAIAGLRQQRFERAVEQFIEVIRSERYYDDDGSRKACIAVFKLLGEDHPVTQRYRREFSSALY